MGQVQPKRLGPGAPAADPPLTGADQLADAIVETERRLQLNVGFDRQRTFIQLGVGIITLLVVTGVSYLVIAQALSVLPTLAAATLPFAGSALLTLLRRLVHSLLGSLAGFAFFDLWQKRRMHQQNLRMDHREMKQEIKETAGDPDIKQAFRERIQDAANQTIDTSKTKANAVVTNPDHYAVGLYFERGKVSLPVVIEKGLDAQAQAIVARARATGTPVIRFRPLAPCCMRAATLCSRFRARASRPWRCCIAWSRNCVPVRW